METIGAQREAQLIDEAEEARWLEQVFAQLEAEAGPPPF